MLTLIFIYCILTFFFFVYHFSCYIFVLFFFTCLLVLVFWLLCRFSLPWPNFLFYCIFGSACVLKTLPLCWILLVQNVSSFCCIVFLFIIVVMCWLLSCLFLFFYPFFPIVVQVSFTIDTCAFFSLMSTLEDHDDQFYSSSPILVFSQLFFWVVFCWCMHFMQYYLSLLHFVQMHISCVPSIKKSFWME